LLSRGDAIDFDRLERYDHCVRLTYRQSSSRRIDSIEMLKRPRNNAANISRGSDRATGATARCLLGASEILVVGTIVKSFALICRYSM
jgi:hypothetical protein